MKWDTEESVKRVVEKWLDKKGFAHDGPRTDKVHGVDIKRWNDIRRKYWFIEVKGAPQKRYQKGPKKGQEKSRQSRSSQRYIWPVEALGQIALRMRQVNGNYGIALPLTEYNQDLALDIELFRKRTKLHFFLVDRRKNIFQLTPFARQFKKV